MSEFNASVSPRMRPSLRRVIAGAFKDAWNHLGLVVAASILIALLPSMLAASFTLLSDSSILALAAAIVAVAILKGPVLAGVFGLAQKMAYDGDAELSGLMMGFCESFGASVMLIAINIAVIACLTADALFFFGIFGQMKPSLLGVILGCLFVYMLIVWFFSTAYQFAIFSAQRPLGQRVGVFPAIYKSLLIVIGMPLYTLGLWLAVIVFVLVCVLSAFGFVLLLGGVTALIFTHALKEVYLCCGVIDESSDDANTP